MLKLAVTLLLASSALLAQALPIVFLVPLEKIDTNVAEISHKDVTYRVVDGAKYLPWLENESAQRALTLYQQAFDLLETAGNPQRQPSVYYIALVDGGNHAAVGFKLKTESGVEEHPRQAYILLDPDPDSFRTTLYHETGHVVMHMLSGGEELPAADVCSIPHSTAALTDRMTAFSEGWAIHLETIAAHFALSSDLRKQYQRTAVLFGEGSYREMEYFRPAADLASYAQNLARYASVRENDFAFQSGYKNADYLRAQLEKGRDFASLRDADQLLQSEGFYASFFFLFVIRGAEPPSEALIRERHQKLLTAMHAMFARVKPEADTPWLLEFVKSYMDVFPAERKEIVEVLNDLSRGVFVDPGAAALWRAHYLAALRLDTKNMNKDAILKTRRGWNEAASQTPQLLFSRLGPQIPCEVKSVPVLLVAFGESSPLLFDINTAEEGVLRTVPGMSDDLLSRWTTERGGKPFLSLEEFRKRVPGAPACQ